MAPRRATLLGSVELSPTVRHLVLRADDGPLGHRAGQWVNLYLDVQGERMRRAYSVANAPEPGDPGRFELAVTQVPGGSVSPILHGMEVGQRLSFDGPHGFFTREGHEADDLWLVGTGTGLAPLRAIAQEVLREPSGPALGLLFGCRSQADILFEPELRDWAATGRLSLHVTLSRPGPGWTGLTGYVQTHLVELLGERRPRVFVCGLSQMIKSVRQVLKAQLGYDRRRIHSERYD